MGFRAAAVMLADVDPEQAEYLGLAIRTPEVRAWAFSSMARLVLVTDKTIAATWYGRAVDACLLITDAMERLRVLSGWLMYGTAWTRIFRKSCFGMV